MKIGGMDLTVSYDPEEMLEQRKSNQKAEPQARYPEVRRLPTVQISSSSIGTSRWDALPAARTWRVLMMRPLLS